VQQKFAKAKRDTSRQTKDSAPNTQSNVMAPPLPPAREGRDLAVRNDEFIEVTFVWTKIQYDPRCNPDLSGHHYMESQTQNCTLPPS